MRRLPLSLFALLIASLAPAQLVVGDIGVTSVLGHLAAVHADGTSTEYTSTSIPAFPLSLLHDPSQLDTFFIGGIGFAGSVTITGPTTAFYNPFPAPVTGMNISQMSWEGSQILAVDSTSDQIIRIDATTGAITPVTVGPQPWGSNLAGICFDPNTGDIYAGALGSIWRIPAGSATPVAFSSGFTVSTVEELVFDPIGLAPVAALTFENRLVRVFPNGIVVDLITGPNPGVRSVDVDHDGSFIIGANASMVFRVPNGGGAAVPIGVAAGVPSTGITVAAVKGPFALAALPFGSGGLSIAITGVPPGTIAGLTIGSFDVSLPVGAGPIFGFSPDAFSVRQLVMFPTPSSGNPNHWTWPVAAPLFPAAPVFVSPGTLPSGTVLDLIGIGINGFPTVTPTPVVRLTIN